MLLNHTTQSPGHRITINFIFSSWKKESGVNINSVAIMILLIIIQIVIIEKVNFTFVGIDCSVDIMSMVPAGQRGKFKRFFAFPRKRPDRV